MGLQEGPEHQYCCRSGAAGLPGTWKCGESPEAQMKHQKLHGPEWDWAGNLSSFLMRFPLSLLVLFELETP